MITLKNELVRIIQEQTVILFDNIQETFILVTDAQMDEAGNNEPH